MRTAVIIPARYGSTRFPGKPLADILGTPLIQRVWALARAVPEVDEVAVATDDARIAERVREFGGHAVMTPGDCRNGTERVRAAAETMPRQPDVVVNLQGDAALVPPAFIRGLVRTLRASPEVAFATPAVRLDDEETARLIEHKKRNPGSGTTVVFDAAGDALYFSKQVIPHRRDPDSAAPVHRHIGMYAYRLDTLRRFTELAPGPLEEAEKLEQLRALEHGMAIRVVVLEQDSGRTLWSVDSPDDLARVESIIGAEGEPIPAYDGSYRLDDA